MITILLPARRAPDHPPRFFLSNCQAIMRPYPWLPYAVLAAELRELDDDIYGGVGPAEVGCWLVDLGVPCSMRRDEDLDEDIPGVERRDIDAEMERRRQQARRRQPIRKRNRL